MSTETSPVWERMDFTHDAIIEASAGTGKTYAMEKIVCRLVCEKGFAAPDILVVTFTEKAAGELRDRVRRALSDAGRLASDFDEMTICTIHSFCKRIIDEYAFESGMPMRSEICASSRELYRRAANSALRDEEFLRVIGERLKAIPPIAAPSISRLVEGTLKGFGEPAELREYEEVRRKLADNPEAAADLDDTPLLRQLVHQRCDAIKLEDAVLTYDDLVSVAADVVTCRNASDATAQHVRERLVESLRRRYRVALVDEFQDTDERQWEIFRTLFSSANTDFPDGRGGFLIVVGDPKQAIYSFRGADVAVYCRARAEISETSQTPPLTLGETYRSTRSLVDAFNVFFGGGWFAGGAAGDGIEYTPVKYPAYNKKFDGLEREDELPPVMLLESVPANVHPDGARANTVHFGNKETLLPVFADAAANEMKRLRGLRGGSANHPLKFSYANICVLVDGKREAAVVRRALERHGIPYGQYKQRGVFASAVAEGVAALFDFLARPAARGRRQALLLSPLFAIRPWQLNSLSEKFEADFNALTDRLAQFAAACDWVRLFEAVMNSDCTALAAPDGDVGAFNRVRSAARQIFDALLSDDATRRARDCTELADALRRLRRDDATAAENGSLFEKESSADRVQIMTMHASKGLQFPIVFVATGFGKKASDMQERRRLLYVAITRAEHRVYLPWSHRAWKWTCSVVQRGKVQSLEGSGIGSRGGDLSEGGFLADAIIRYAEFAGTKALFPEDEIAAANTGGVAKAEEAAESEPPPPAAVELEVPSLWNRRLHWESFTSLQAKLESAGERGGDDTDREFHAKSLAPSLLPRSNVTGNVFHEVMETLCGNDEAAGQVGFCNAQSPDFEPQLLELVRRAMRRNALANREAGGDSSEAAIVRMARRTLAAPVEIGGETLTLSRIPRRDRLAEVDFVLRAEDLPGIASIGGGATILNGKIDLVIRFGNRAYVIDWKTNSLEDYSSSSVAQAMDDANYHLQYRLYAMAAREWLRPHGLILAGAAYIFVRGAEAGPLPGVFSTIMNHEL